MTVIERSRIIHLPILRDHLRNVTKPVLLIAEAHGVAQHLFHPFARARRFDDPRLEAHEDLAFFLDHAELLAAFCYSGRGLVPVPSLRSLVMRDLKFCLRMFAAFIAIVLVLSIAQKWDDADTDHVRASIPNT
jgi:hypothetical protein